MRFDLADLRLFLCIADAGSITQGAQAAHLALASASERLRNMEHDAGVALLERRSRGVVATQAGEAVAHHARLILQQQALLKSELNGFANGARGTLSLYANTAALTHFLPPRLADWLSGRPDIHVDLRERTSLEIVQGVAAGMIEAGIISDSCECPGLHVRPVARDHLLLIVPPSHHLAARSTIRFADVLNEVFVGLASGNALQDHIQDQAEASGRSLTLRIRMKTFDGLCTMVDQGVGIGIVPQSIADELQPRYAYARVALEDDWACRQLCVVYRDWLELSPAMHSFLRHLGVPAD
ncbi:LysR family transcriptional regulator [Pseudomonas sp. S75]|uniref:LysR family transcriptional regulator n=1 Tax=unclassified Pseudomonas TaxID=196821 RepID=UPI0019036D82|nr:MULTISPECIES: LysR substrate-binding domain-containing protein [unclassified Pseudomonas]MBJ9977623.1 LysR family transcriptional regulator [Pseudomonas sp. S30]MBK0154995.1 LysR family transcriptional regulator [Pseudomonas sp. S75]